MSAYAREKAEGSEPPSGPPWDAPLAEAPLVFVDLEMTGLDPARDRIVEACVERVVGGVVQGRIASLIRPENGMIGNVHVHGIDEPLLRGAPLFSEVAPSIAALLAGAVFVAHGAKWDVAFLNQEFARAGVPFCITHWIDTLTLARRALGLERHSLDALRAHFGLSTERSHRADADVEALREVFDRCARALAPETPRDLFQVRVAEHKARDHIIAQCKEFAQKGCEVLVTVRPRSRPAQSLRMVITSVAEGLDPPRVIGYLLPGRGRRELRADRILRIDLPTNPS